MAIPCKIRIVKPLDGVYPKYQPKVGRVYNAKFVEARPRPGNYSGKDNSEFCIIDIADKKIVVRPGEYEMIEMLEPDNSEKTEGGRICIDCGKRYDGGPMARFCPTCKKKRLSDNAKRNGLCYTGGAAFAAKLKGK